MTEQNVPVPDVPDSIPEMPTVIDLDQERRLRAAKREGKRQPLPIRCDGQVIATLPVELPIDVFEPLRGLDADLTLVLRYAMQAYKTQGEERANAAETVIDVLAANPGLPVTVLTVLTQVARNLLTDEGFEAFRATRPSGDDIAALTKGVFRFYGLNLGELSEPNGSSTPVGTTSSTTSKPTSESTPEESGPTPQIPASSASAVS